MPTQTRKPSTTNGAKQSRTMKAVADAEVTEDQDPLFRLVVTVVTDRETYKIDYTEVTGPQYQMTIQTLNGLLNDPARCNRSMNLTGSDGVMHMFNIDHVVALVPTLTQINS